MKALILLVCIALGLGYLAFDRHHKLEREKFLAAEKIRIRAEEERRREERRREEERKQKLEKYTLQIKENEKQIALMHQQLEELNQKLDKAKSARNHEPLAFDERRTLQREISTLKYEQKKIAQ